MTVLYSYKANKLYVLHGLMTFLFGVKLYLLLHYIIYTNTSSVL